MCFLYSAVVAGCRAYGFEALLDPALLRHVGDVHVFGADGAAIGFPQHLQDVLQLHLARADQRAGAEHGFHVGVAQPVERRIELGDIGFFLALERIDVGVARTLETISADQLQHPVLLFAELRLRYPNSRGRRAALPGELGEMLLDGLDGKRRARRHRAAAARRNKCASAARPHSDPRDSGRTAPR